MRVQSITSFIVSLWNPDLVLVVRDVWCQGLHLAVKDVVILHLILHRRQVLAKSFVGQVVLQAETGIYVCSCSDEALPVQSSGIQVFQEKTFDCLQSN